MAEAISLERVYGELGQYKGTAKKRVSDEQLHQIKEEVAMKHAQERGIDLN